MKNLYYLTAIVLLSACSNNKPEPQAVTPTPTGMAGLQQTKVASPVNQLKSNLIYNPAHGQPGHSCAVAVGAPLNRPAPAKPNLNQPQSPAPVSNPAPVAKSTLTAVNAKGQKLNPKHGESGHRCDLAIGAPLNSKPLAAPKVMTSSPVADNKALEAKNGIKINPKHGEAGHRCDIAVGAPLT
ncbi:hypothetical protein [Pedobacter punctiformis]|uniref:Uncharacterized protein n=1 Tax=Pedobacter punctiformis TaxID=3004097 RepID=A0ABT4L5J8_9SPHI|nr:hypothetical protein [Pedobacter sp. HCMS5-2]MCZ4242957.1 hypothetical protein [Pedobacter sp. HCMS5-2]